MDIVITSLMNGNITYYSLYPDNLYETGITNSMLVNKYSNMESSNKKNLQNTDYLSEQYIIDNTLKLKKIVSTILNSQETNIIQLYEIIYNYLINELKQKNHKIRIIKYKLLNNNNTLFYSSIINAQQYIIPKTYLEKNNNYFIKIKKNEYFNNIIEELKYNIITEFENIFNFTNFILPIDNEYIKIKIDQLINKKLNIYFDDGKSIGNIKKLIKKINNNTIEIIIQPRISIKYTAYIENYSKDFCKNINNTLNNSREPILNILNNIDKDQFLKKFNILNISDDNIEYNKQITCSIELVLRRINIL
jgi:hypothetical protein